MPTDLPFLHAFMREIERLHGLPKVQVERIMGPLLGMFLPAAIAPSLAPLGAPDGFEVVAPEFPLRAIDSNQSTNIDWLLVHRERGIVVFLELKTDRGSMALEQVEIYHSLCERIATSDTGAGFLVDDVERIATASASRKYAALRNAIAPFESTLRSAREAHTVWLVPHGTSAPAGTRSHVVHFGDLTETIAGEFANEWRVVREGLVAIEKMAPAAAPAIADLSSASLARHILANLGREGESAKPARFWFGAAARERPNYQVEFSNGEIRTYRYGGSRFGRAERFDATKLSGPHEFDVGEGGGGDGGARA